VAAVLDAHHEGSLIALRTSGTSGPTRAVVRTTASWFDSFPAVTELLGLSPSSRVWVPGPLAATMNLFAAVHAVHVGADVVPDPSGATHGVLTPAGLARTLAQDVPLPAHLVIAGDRLGRGLRDDALARGVGRVSHYYGAAELSFVAWGSCEEDLRPFPGVEVASRAGEVWVRSPFVCDRYVGPAGPLRRGSDGFVTVGDRGRVDGAFLRVHGRGTDTVVTAGATVPVGDVEAALEASTGRRVAVLGLPHPDLGALLCAATTDDGSLPELRRAAREVLDPSHRPRRWFVVPELPLTAAGKLDRERLRELVQQARSVGTP
jgi:acyl-CoA synthetase (AMP-forming)/AMP-acid ligase II